MISLLLVGCMGPADETFIGELRVVAMAANAPGAAPGTPFELTITVADPLGEGGDLLVWSCLPEPPTGAMERCASRLLPLDREHLTVDWVGVAPVPLWAMACAPGLCGDLTDVAEARLVDPIAWLTELPVAGVSAGFRTTPWALPDAPPPTNPDLAMTPSGEPIAADPVDGTTLAFTANGATTAYGYATAGGFGPPATTSPPMARWSWCGLHRSHQPLRASTWCSGTGSAGSRCGRATERRPPLREAHAAAFRGAPPGVR